MKNIQKSNTDANEHYQELLRQNLELARLVQYDIYNCMPTDAHGDWGWVGTARAVRDLLQQIDDMLVNAADSKRG